jgi:hypothetical protein
MRWAACAPLLSRSRRFRLSGKACANASTKSWKFSALRYGSSRKNRPDCYELLVYRLLRNGLEAGDLFRRDSVRFRSFEDDLRDDQRWQAKDGLIANAGLALLTQPIQEHLAALE